MTKLNELIASLNDKNISDEVKQDIQKEIDTLAEQNKKLYARAKTAEGFIYDKEKKEWVKKETKPAPKEVKPEAKKEANASSYSLVDIRALNKVHDDDVERVEKFAAAEGLSISDALKNDDLKAILRDREEKRKSADAANVGGGRRGSSSSSPEKILAEAQKGNYPTDDAGIKKLIDAEFEQNLARARK